MSLTADEAKKLLEYSVQNPGTVPRQAIESAAAALRGGGQESIPPKATGPGVVNLPEQEIRPRDLWGRLFNTGVDFDATKAQADTALAEKRPERSQAENLV